MRSSESLYYNASVYTMEPGIPRASALAVRDGTIVAVGTRAEAEAALHGPCKAVDLRGHTVVPAFTDSHIHFLWYALGLRRLNLDGIRSIGQVVRMVAERAAQAKPGEWIVGHGWNRSIWPDGDIPTRFQLDAAAPENPVALSSKDGHTRWANTLALAAAGVDRDTGDPDGGRDGGRIDRDPESGEPTGLLRENAQDLMERAIPVPGAEALEDAVLRGISRTHELGIVGIHDCEDQIAFRVFGALARGGKLGLRVFMMIPRANLEAAIQVGLKTGLGDSFLRVGPLKLFADGALGSRTAALLEPYASDSRNTGIVVTTREELAEIVKRASAASIAVAVHAIGDRANRDVLDAFEEAAPASRSWSGLRHRIEHAQLVHPADLPRFASLGIIASVQPIHATSDRYMADRHWGTRASPGYAYGSLASSGARLAFGSDAPVEEPDPIAGIFAAVTRKRADEILMPGWHTEESLSVEQAVHGYTLGAAYASGEDSIKGSISPGKLADFVVLSRDIFTIPRDEIIQAKVLATVMGGRSVFDRTGLLI